MSLSVFVSNDILSLANELEMCLQKTGGNVFVPTYIVTQTKGMNNWLKYKIAEDLGIAANLNFLSPDDVIYEVYKVLGGNYAGKVKKLHVDWLIYEILSDDEFCKKFPHQAGYFHSASGDDPLKKWELAFKIADLFDQYQIYREGVISNWNRGEEDGNEIDERWQAYIWRQLKQITSDNIIDMSEVKKFINEALQDKNKVNELIAKIPGIYLFGLSILTPLHLEIFKQLSQHIEMGWYLTNPAPEVYWIDDIHEKKFLSDLLKKENNEYKIVGHPLLTSWGKVIKDTYKLLFKDDDLINLYSEVNILDFDSHTLLSTVQSSIHKNDDKQLNIDSSKLKDGSIVIASHFSKFREVEGVYNYLTDVLSKNKQDNIKERDVIVMVSNINEYAPIIRAVFDNAPYKYQYSIADEAITNGDSVISALMAILQLSQSTFTAEEVLKLLSFRKIRKKFGIENTELIRNAVITANIHFGYENDYYQPIDDTYLVSWKYGIQKLMYGICIAGENLMHYHHPFYTVECADNIAEINQITRFVTMVEMLAVNMKKRQYQMSVSEWKTFIEDILADFIISDESDKDDLYSQIINKFDEIDYVSKFLKDLEVPFDVFTKKLVNSLNYESSSGNFLSRGITFCSPLPYRSIPFKVVAMLGLNQDTFPRKLKKLQFDLMAANPRPGDRNIRNNDKHLFLESILSARNYLYLSYIGKSIQNNKDLPPSFLIDELIDFIQSGCSENVAEILIQKHPLHSFSEEYNKDEDNTKHNYFIHHAAPWPLKSKEEEPKEENTGNSNKKVEEIDIAKVLKFFKKGIQYYYNEILNIYTSKDDEEISDTELFDLDNLEIWHLNQALIHSKFRNNESEIYSKLYLNGKFPLKNAGEAYKMMLDDNLKNLFRNVVQIFEENQTLYSISIDYTYKNIRFYGTIPKLVNHSPVELINKSGKELKTGQKAELIFYLLIAKIVDTNTQSAYLFYNDGFQKTRQIDREEARNLLNGLLDYFIENQEEPNLFKFNTYTKQGDWESIEKTIDKELKSNYNNNKSIDKYKDHAKEISLGVNRVKLWQGMNSIIDQLMAIYE
ncbi:MAG: exodeoxyribonuclease V subunit gamma [Saprospiraceae bacterium]|nr:exodeoxyribonuclease V subunit gamma [Saprospiraceae bacterium]